jgi:N-acetylmuramoyl-L-alanine amidase
LTFSSSNKKVATVSKTGVVTAVKKGTATITVTANDGSDVSASCKVKVTKNLVLVLDPGHGGRDSGAVNKGRGLIERDINLQIAKACRNYLENNYEGVTVFLTRESNTSTLMGLAGRAKFAKTAKADALISLHINASGYRGSTGAEVWVTRSTAKTSYNTAMKALAKNILTQLNKCGIRRRGIFTRKSSYLRYSNGQIADYYGVIRESIYRDIPAMIVEHAYIDSSDYQFLNSKAKTKKLGVADAKGIAAYYGLSKRTDTDSDVLVSGIKLNCNEDSLSIKKGSTYQLKATTAPKTATDTSVSYASSDTSIVSVSANGKLKAKKKGTATITCKAQDSGGMTTTLTVVVR